MKRESKFRSNFICISKKNSPGRDQAEKKVSAFVYATLFE